MTPTQDAARQIRRKSEARPASTGLLGPSVRTLLRPAFDQSCADLMRLVEADYAPSVIIGIRTGGLVVAEAMAHVAAASLPVLPLTCRRASTDTKSRLPLLRTTLGALPRPLVNLLRRVEHRYVTAGRVRQSSEQVIDQAELAAIGAYLAAGASPARILVADDAVDSGVTLATVLELLQGIVPAGSDIRSAAITQTLEHPKTFPDYVLFHGTLCRFPWSFDAAG